LTTWGEIEELATTVNKIDMADRENKQAEKELKARRAREPQDKILQTILDAGLKIAPEDDEKTKEAKARKIEKTLGKYAKFQGSVASENLFGKPPDYWDINVRRFARMLDGGKDGINTLMLYTREAAAFNEKQRWINKRQARTNASLKANGINIQELYKQVDFSDMGVPYLNKLSVDDMLYIKYGAENLETRKALAYGNFLSAGEQRQWEDAAKGTNSAEAIRYQIEGERRLTAVLGRIDEFFKKPENAKFLQFAETIAADYREAGARLNEAMIRIYGRPMARVEKYVPMYRLSGTAQESEALRDLMAWEGITSYVGKGMTVTRLERFYLPCRLDKRKILHYFREQHCSGRECNESIRDRTAAAGS
jgi:hypothetical protein